MPWSQQAKSYPGRYIDSNRLLLVIAIMALMAYGIAGLAIWIIYQARLEQYSQNLLGAAQNKVALLEYVTRQHYEKEHDQPPAPGNDTSGLADYPLSEPERVEILEHFAQAVGGSGSFRLTGENLLVYTDEVNDYGLSSTEMDEPLRRALAGESGTIIARDYRGKRVIAALVPLPQLGAAMVVKMDMTEFSAPYRRAAIITLLVGTALIFGCGLFCWREGHRIIGKLAASESRYRTLMDNVPLCVFLKDGNGHYLTANRYFYLRYGVDKKSIPEMSDHAIFPPEVARKHINDDQRVLEEGITLTGYETQMLNGEERIIRYLKCPLKNDEGEPRGIVGIHQDVTQDRRNSEALKQLNAELESQVRKRTAQFELANRELESFAYSVSHDLRAPLRAMAGFSEALKEEYENSFDATAADYIKRIHRATGNMAELIDSLLSLSRSTTGELKVVPLDLSRMSADVVDDLRSASPDHRPQVQIAPNLNAEGDSRLIRNVLENLIGNAWKYTRLSADPQIEIGSVMTRPPDEGSEEAAEIEAFFVRDNGAGFDMTYANKLFRPFQRLHTEKEFQGSGIGLATVERIIHRHNGQIWAHSEPGRGATFYFTLDQLA
jgi:PAS domain S-box-containing protein